MTHAEVWPILFDTVKNGTVHKHYKECVDYAELCRKLITGKDCDTLLEQIVTRETPAQFELRKKLFFPLPPSICAKAKVPFTKATRVDGTITDARYDGDRGDAGAKRKKLNAALDGFFGEESLDDYLDTRFLALNMMDPNAFVVVDFDAFDNKKGQAKPYPLEIFSKDVLNFGGRNTVEWLIAQFASQYTDKEGKKQEGIRYVAYFGQVLDMVQVEFDDTIPEVTGNETVLPPLVKIKDRCFMLSQKFPFTEKQQPEFQGIRVGHVMNPDIYVDNYVSSIHAGINRMLETLKAGSEHSLVMALQAHPQVFQYLPKCQGVQGDVCDSGKNRSGNTCAACGGSGKRIPTSVLDAMIFDMPDEKEEYVLPLSEMKYTHAPDTAIITLLNDYIKGLEQAALQDIFTSNLQERSAVSATATEVSIDADAQNSAVVPYARKLVTAYIKIARICAAFVDADKGLTVVKEIPDDMQLEPLSSKIATLTAAQGTGSPDVINAAEEDVMFKKLQNRPEDLLRYKVRKRFRPLVGLSDDVKRQAMASELVTTKDKVLLIHENEVYLAMDRIPNFYNMAVDLQRKLIYKEVDRIIERIREEQAQLADFMVEDPTNQGDRANEKKKVDEPVPAE